MTKVGEFVWHEVMTRDTAAAGKFYTALFGWTLKETDMGPMGKYTMIHVGDRAIGGMMHFDKAPPHWMPYCTVENVDASVKRVERLGGKICVPGTDIPNVGRFAVIEDTQGAYLSLYQSNQPATLPERPPVGDFCWDELLTNDTARSQTFYTELFSWKPEAMDMGPMGAYTIWKRGDKQCGGMMKSPMPNMPPNWLSYVHVENVDASVRKAQSLGASVVAPAMDAPNIGRFAALADPVGAVFAVFTPTTK